MRSEQMQEDPAYWSAALETRQRQMLAEGTRPVAESNTGLYVAAIAREIRSLVAETAEIEEGRNWVLLRLSAEFAFGIGSAELSDPATEQLKGCARVFTDYDLSLLEISGHTDNTGSAQINQQLSEQRARAVAQLLEMQGVAPLRMVVEGRSDTQPLAANESPEGRRMNRRVEIRVIPLLARKTQAEAGTGKGGSAVVEDPDSGASR